MEVILIFKFSSFEVFFSEDMTRFIWVKGKTGDVKAKSFTFNRKLIFLT